MLQIGPLYDGHSLVSFVEKRSFDESYCPKENEIIIKLRIPQREQRRLGEKRRPGT